MPLIDVTYDQTVGETAVRRLREVLPDVVAHAVACAEEPWIGPPEPGDIELRFRCAAAAPRVTLMRSRRILVAAWGRHL